MDDGYTGSYGREKHLLSGFRGQWNRADKTDTHPQGGTDSAPAFAARTEHGQTPLECDVYKLALRAGLGFAAPLPYADKACKTRSDEQQGPGLRHGTERDPDLAAVARGVPIHLEHPDLHG